MTPNILILMADQMTGDVVRAGHPCHMPSACRLAGEGVRFTNAFCPTPHCCPARASFFTGHLPSRHGIWNSIDGRNAFAREFAEGVGTFGEQLAAAGYAMAFAGKWHASRRDPSHYGWDVIRVERPAVEKGATVDEASVLKRPGWGGKDRIFSTVASPQGLDTFSDRLIDASILRLKEFADRSAPWCMFIGVDPPHDPYEATREEIARYPLDNVRLPRSFDDRMHDKPRIAQRLRAQLWDQLGEPGARACLQHYWASCSRVDAWLGRLLDALEQTNQSQNTFVLLCSDHGDYAGAHGLWCKGAASLREAYSIPAIVRWPAGLMDPGRDSEALVSIADFCPTFLEVAGVGASDDRFGRSILPLLRSRDEPSWRRALIGQFNGVELYYSQRSIWTHEWKYVFNGFDNDEMYDLTNDPHEMVNLVDPARWTGSTEPRIGSHPALPPPLDRVRRELLKELWRVMRANGDRYLENNYWTVGLAPYGPGIAEDDA